MYPDASRVINLVVSLALVVSSEAFFLKWGSDTSSQSQPQKAWVQPPNVSPNYRYQYSYTPYEARKLYSVPPPQYQQAEMSVQQNLAPIPISVPAGASLTPVSLQHVQLVPCMCPVAPEEAEKLQEQVGPGPYLAQTYSQGSYTVPQQVQVNQDQQPSKKQ